MTEPAAEAKGAAASESLIDRAHLERQTAGDVDLAQELLTLFRDQCRRLMPRLRNEDGAREHRADVAHTLKGSALGVGASRVAARAAAVEYALRSAAPEPRDAVSALAEAVERTLAAIEMD